MDDASVSSVAWNPLYCRESCDEPGDQAVEQPEPVNSLKGQPQVPGQRKNED